MTSFSTEPSQVEPRAPVARLKIVPLGGPLTSVLTLDPREKSSCTIGRRIGHDLQLQDPASRDHARLGAEQTTSGVQWFLVDTNSKHGTKLNGVRLVPQQQYPIRHGDLIHIVHWSFRVKDADVPWASGTVVRMADDSDTADNTIHDIGRGTDLAHQRLSLMMKCAETIHRAENEQSLADAIIETLVVGTGLPNAALLRLADEQDSIEIVSARGAILDSKSQPQISRSLVMRAKSGFPCRLNGPDKLGEHQHSVVRYGIDEAMCVPINLSGTVAGYIYLDGRGESAYDMYRAADAGAFAVCIAQLASMALANLMRLDLQRRKAKLDAEVAATGEAQRLLLPRRSGVAGEFEYVGENRPGRVVSGDFFDVIPLDDHRLAVTVGDVVGKGITASVLMTVAVGFLRAAMVRHGHPGKALEELNTYLHPRCGAGRFITLWAGVFDADRNTLTYTDAGHGYAFLYGGSASPQQLNKGKALPIGILAEATCQAQSVELPRDARLLVISDGIVEQPIGSSGDKQLFGVESVHSATARLPQDADMIEVLFAALEAQAGTNELHDDATALMVRYANR